MEADLNTLVLLLDKAYRHYLFDIPKEDYEGLLNLVKKKGKDGQSSILEIEAIGDNVFVRWTSRYHPDTYNGANWITIKNGKIIADREYYKRIN